MRSQMTRAIAGVHPHNTLALRARGQFASVRRAVRAPKEY
jgi:hypothetical protein